MSQHSVGSHLRIDVDGYDASIRKFVPHYDEMITTGVALLGAIAPADARILDLGGGTGALTAEILRSMPRARVTLLDIDAEMLEQARARLASDSERVSFVRGSFFDTLTPHDAVVASLSLHHIADIEKKTRVYESIFEMLPRGGIFVCLDATVSRDPAIAARTFHLWAESMGEHGIDEATARGHFDAWSKEDFYMPLSVELDALSKAGFTSPECFFRRGPATVYGAIKR